MKDNKNKQTNESRFKYISLELGGYSKFSTTEKNAFHVYVSLLSKFNNNLFKNKTYQEIADKVGVSRSKLFTYLNILERWDLIERTDRKQNLLVIPQEKLKNTHYTVIKIYRSIKAKDIQKVILQSIVSNNINTQEWNIVMKDLVSDKPQINNNEKAISKRELYKLTKRAIKVRDNNGTRVNGVVDTKTYTSLRLISRLMGISLSQSHTLFHKMDKSMFSFEWNFELIDSNISYEKFREYKRSFNLHTDIYTKLVYKKDGGKVYIHRGSKIDFGNNLVVATNKYNTANRLVGTLYSRLS